jgi:adenosylcobinamide-phosphate synthase
MAVAGGAGMVLGAVLDEVLGDPRRWHPVAGFGALAVRLERRMYRADRVAGVRYVAVLVGVPVAAAGAVAAATRRRPVARAVAVAATTWLVLGGRSLRREAGVMGAALAAGDLAAARERLPHLCGRDPVGLGSDELARATVESVAENTSDAVVGALCWGALLGLPGLVGYRVVNTLDAMIGHRSPRYARFGWAAARLDDLANLAPARLTALLTVALANRAPRGTPAQSGSRALRVWVRDGGRHPSPNSGQCEAAMAGALGVRLGGRNVYQGRVEERPVLGDGRAPDALDVRRAARLSAAVGVAALALAAGHVAFAPARRRILAAARGWWV